MGNLKLKELKYNGKSIKDDFHQMVLFDKDYRLIRYGSINNYAESYIMSKKEVSGNLYVVIDKVCSDDDLDTICNDKISYEPEVKQSEPTIHFDKKSPRIRIIIQRSLYANGRGKENLKTLLYGMVVYESRKQSCHPR